MVNIGRSSLVNTGRLYLVKSNPVSDRGITRFFQEYGSIEEPVKIICGLPIEMLTGDSMRKNVSDVQRWLKKEHSWVADGKEYYLLVDEVRVTSQPGGAFFDFILDEGGNMIPTRQYLYTQEVGILSIGMNTVETLVIRNKSIIARFSAGATFGVRRLLELVNSLNEYSIGELDSLLRSGALDISQDLPIWREEVTGFVEKTWGKNWRRFSCILIVGGGAILLHDSLSYYFQGKAHFPEDPILSISRGLYKLGVHQKKKRN